MEELPRTILADVPFQKYDWHWKEKSVFPAEHYYKVMSLSELKQYRFPHNEKQSLLLFWAWNSCLLECLDIIKAWGFQYRNMITWIKPHVGLGVYIRNSTEHLILATKGSKSMQKSVKQLTWFIAEKREHSRKPEMQYDIAERLGYPPYIELFARRRREGWLSIGNELPEKCENVEVMPQISITLLDYCIK